MHADARCRSAPVGGRDGRRRRSDVLMLVVPARCRRRCPGPSRLWKSLSIVDWAFWNVAEVGANRGVGAARRAVRRRSPSAAVAGALLRALRRLT